MMRVEFQRTGGAFGPPQQRSYTIDTVDLAPEEAQALTALVQSSGILVAGEEATVPRDVPRRYRYRITVEQDGQNHRVHVSEADLPNALRPLVNWLSQRAIHTE
jgi:hypothetical protein